MLDFDVHGYGRGEGGRGLFGGCWAWVCDAEESEDVAEVVLCVGDESLVVVSMLEWLFMGG